ncbi:hypothetical protein AZE42_11848 [Rhizopogon vesiculosus]|uniref:Uncharacterized protein n=1 Tax=Rhizopogon vesiculosus TaxID=180088 RepID=A0A1J8R0J6_9AGAM|nr:hypothetical protein AZE42_11848 [Rhizopogon vesiculosus]
MSGHAGLFVMRIAPHMVIPICR